MVAPQTSSELPGALDVAMIGIGHNALLGDDLGIDGEKLNPFGGAIALGHPFGMTGARIMTTLLNDLETLDKTYGIESMCVAGGMGQAMLVERLN